jgi:hypothetical protein
LTGPNSPDGRKRAERRLTGQGQDPMKSSKSPSLSPPFGGADRCAATEDGGRHKRMATIRAAIPAPTRAPRRKQDSEGFTRLSDKAMMRMLLGKL